MADSGLCKLSLQLVFVTLSWSTTIALSFLELAEEDCFGHAYIFHPSDVASLAQLHLKQDGLYAWQAGSHMLSVVSIFLQSPRIPGFASISVETAHISKSNDSI